MTESGKTIAVRYHADIPKIRKTEVGDWIDLYAAEDVHLLQGECRPVSLGVSMKLPDGYEAHIVPRSSTFKNWGILQTNGMGIIDNSYSGDNDVWGMPVYATRNTSIKKGDRICQFRIVKKMDMPEFAEVDSLGGEDRGGFPGDFGVEFYYRASAGSKEFQGEYGDGLVECERVPVGCEDGHVRLPAKHVRAHLHLFGGHHIRRIGGDKVEGRQADGRRSALYIK